MDAQIPKGSQSMTPTSLPNIAWFEFILNEKLLKEHLSQENPDPTPCQLIIQFLQQAEIEMAAVVQASNNISPLSVNKNEESKVIEPTKKVRALRLLALKVGCHLKWNLINMEKSIPTPILQALLILLLQTCVPSVIDNIHNPDLDVSTLSPLGLFVVHLFHRWCVRSVVRDSFPSKPTKQSYMALPGQIDPNIVMAQATDTIIRKFKEELEASIILLENCLNVLDSTRAQMPTSDCFQLPQEDRDEQLNWGNTKQVVAEEMICQICFDIGAVYFYKSDYRKSYEKFRLSNILYNQLTDPVYCYIDLKRLHGYMTSCSSLLGVTADLKTTSLFDRAELARRRNFQGIVEILNEDNLKQELDMAYRGNLQDEIFKKGLSDLHIRVYLSNVIRSALQGKALVSPILETLKNAQQDVLAFTIQLLKDVLRGSTANQKSNLKCFVWNVIELLPPDSRFSRQVLTSELVSYFDAAEVAELSVDEDVRNNSYLLEIAMDDPASMTSINPNTRESSYNMSDVEGQLLSVYDPRVIKDILTELYEHRRLNAAQILSLNDKWKVPKELKQVLDLACSDKLKEFDQIYVYLLIAKAKHCIELKIYDRALQLLPVAESILANTSIMAAKHVRWQMLFTQLHQYKLNDRPQMNVQELVVQCKQCLTAIRLGQDLQPSREIIEECTAFLCNSGEWQYLSDCSNTGNGFVEFSHLLGLLIRDIQEKKNVRKQARDLWDAVLVIYQAGNGKRQHDSRQQWGILSKNELNNFMHKMKDQCALSVLISLFCKLYTLLSSSELVTDYIYLWPAAIQSSLTAGVVEESLKILLSYSLLVDPTQPSWLRIKADLHFIQDQFSMALKFYLEAGVVATDFFTCPVPRSIYDDVVFRRMIKCCSYLQCHTQVAVLCQFLEEVDYNTAFKALHERNVYDAMDAYYCCIWDVSILEFLVHLHTRKGEVEKRQTAMQALTQMDLNSNNPDQIQRRAVHIRKTKFLRALAKQYLG
ncbi:integrator complex subunit 8-like [Physella acuta]|uniref:integrator complex subunit 8-like n=1 Tax=Physella acuta TaxID=109671 RepID=UPI0027DD1697|nr:integrator complex subunit 8-like [Physella acuta]